MSGFIEIGLRGSDYGNVKCFLWHLKWGWQLPTTDKLGNENLIQAFGQGIKAMKLTI